MTNVFISYRREDTTAGFAALLHQRLATTVRGNIFMDVDNLPFGVDWQDHIQAALQDCDVAFVLIGALWLTTTDDQGNRRLNDPSDVLRLEIAEVLRRTHVRVIPVLFGAARMPRAIELPEDIRSLTGKQALFWSLNEGTRSQLQKIENAVRLGPLVGDGRDANRTQPLGNGDRPQIGGAFSARVLALCAELLDELAEGHGRQEVLRIQRTLQRPGPGGGHLLADAIHADASLEALDTLAWTRPELRFIRDRVEELRDSGPEMQMIQLAKWYERWSAGEVELPEDKQAELERLLTAHSTAERVGLDAGATPRDVHHAAADRVQAWREFEAGGLASPMAQRVAGDVVRFYEELAV